MDRGAWWTTVHGVAKSQMQLDNNKSPNEQSWETTDGSGGDVFLNDAPGWKEKVRPSGLEPFSPLTAADLRQEHSCKHLGASPAETSLLFSPVLGPLWMNVPQHTLPCCLLPEAGLGWSEMLREMAPSPI